MRLAIFSLAVCGLVLGSSLARAASQPIYNEHAHARQDIAAAVAAASKTGRDIVLIFGANWWPDCHALDAQMHKPTLAQLIARNFVVVKIDVGLYNKNIRLAAKYGVPISKGIPALAVLSSHGKLLYAQSQGQFQNAHAMPYRDIADFFERWKPKR